jgi:Reverse transcriptase (RNA-dependent DNA polymerase).
MSPILFNLYGEYLMKEALAKVGDFKIGGRIINKMRFLAVIAKTQEELQDMMNRLVEIGRKHSMEINIDKSQVMKISRSNDSLQIKVYNRELSRGTIFTLCSHTFTLF